MYDRDDELLNHRRAGHDGSGPPTARGHDGDPSARHPRDGYREAGGRSSHPRIGANWDMMPPRTRTTPSHHVPGGCPVSSPFSVKGPCRDHAGRSSSTKASQTRQPTKRITNSRRESCTVPTRSAPGRRLSTRSASSTGPPRALAGGPGHGRLAAAWFPDGWPGSKQRPSAAMLRSTQGDACAGSRRPPSAHRVPPRICWCGRDDSSEVEASPRPRSASRGHRTGGPARVRLCRPCGGPRGRHPLATD